MRIFDAELEGTSGVIREVAMTMVESAVRNLVAATDPTVVDEKSILSIIVLAAKIRSAFELCANSKRVAQSTEE